MSKNKKNQHVDTTIAQLAGEVEQMRIIGMRGHIHNFRRVGVIQELLSKFLQTMDDQYCFEAYDKLHELCTDFQKAIDAEHRIYQKKKESESNGGSTIKS